MTRRGSVYDPLLCHINNGEIEAVQQMFRDSHVQEYERDPQKRHQALCAAIRTPKFSPEDRALCVRMLTCNLQGYNPHFQGGAYKKTIEEIARDEGCDVLLPLLMQDSEQVSLHPLDLFPKHHEDAAQGDAAAAQDPREAGRHFCHLRYLLEYGINAAVLYRKSHSKVVAISRNSAFDQEADAALLHDIFPITEEMQANGLTVNGRAYAYFGSMPQLSEGTSCSWAQFKAKTHGETLLLAGSRDLVVAAQFGSDINSKNPEFQEEEEEEIVAALRTSSIAMPGHHPAAQDNFDRACEALRALLVVWVDGDL